MATSIQVTFDSHDPWNQAEFWAQALHYIVQPPPPGFDSWDDWMDSMDFAPEDRNNMAAIVDPEGAKPRILFVKVPEDKTVKNRVHLDVNVTVPGTPENDRIPVIDAEVDRLEELGARRWERRSEFGHSWFVMYDPEGNEFCVQ